MRIFPFRVDDEERDVFRTGKPKNAGGFDGEPRF